MVEPAPRSKSHPALRRIRVAADEFDVDSALSRELAAPDVATLLLHAFEARACATTAAQVMRQ